VQFGIFYEHQLPRPWQPDSEERLIREALEQVELADRLGVDYAWEVEHHFLEEYPPAARRPIQRREASTGPQRDPSGHAHPGRAAVTSMPRPSVTTVTAPQRSVRSRHTPASR
jgi:alkanesulfonate monooxygenase SsuD/methylene tetrahydromethanopterin reductase-like flavin-dependent oxidoreductase (luciferase family)